MSRTRIDACYQPRQVFRCPRFFEKLVIANHVGSVCQSRLLDFIIEENTEQRIFTVIKRTNVCLRVRRILIFRLLVYKSI